ncbi:NigD1/NigD2 family lipoprotein [Prevotella sp.]|uniref:NigD1/NigD2 family lipoprotein n=1 Tax=Prevotella sp. TaxID=59823 RepID=UPI0027E21D26|nr:NigD-like C-terminal domain-containing protein [Prevotella sp.]
MALIGMASCQNEGYDTGDSEYSYITAELALLHTNSNKAVAYATLDDGSSLQFASKFTTKWTDKVDTVYRALLYYDKALDGSTTVKARGVTQVPVIGVVKQEDVKNMCTDPLDIESVWMAKNKTFINLSLLLKSGTTESDNQQSIGLVELSRSVDADNRKRVILQVYHDQGNVPQYYTVQQYASIDLTKLDANIVEIQANTYNGVKRFVVE